MVLTDDMARPHDVVAQPEQAKRQPRARWRDPRLAIGVALVVMSAVIGARVVGAADDTVPVLVAATSIGRGQELTAGMVEIRDVRIDDVSLYLTGQVGSGYVVTREVRRGELIPSSAISKATDLRTNQVVRYVPVALPTAELPDGLVPGSAVDVWTTAEGAARAQRLAANVQVSAVAGGSSGALGVEGSSATVTLAVVAGPKQHAQLVSRLVAAARDGRVYLSRLAAGSGGLG